MAEFDPKVLAERPIPPPAEFSRQARVKSLDEYRRLYQRAVDDPESYWAEQARLLDWAVFPTRVLEWNPPFARWFSDGKLNVAHNCLDRHLADKGEKVALYWEGEDGSQRRLTYRELHEQVCRFANVLKSLGIGRGDKVAIYMPLVPELPVAMLASARIGAVHSVVFGGFSAPALADRIADAGARLLVTADGGYRRGKVIALKEAADAALAKCPTVERCVVVRRTGKPVPWQPGRDLWWHELLSQASPHCPAEPMDAEQPLFILYTSGTTGKPKGVLHTSGGYLTQCAWSTRLVFDLRENDIYWCAADIGWVTGHSYVV